MGETNAGSGEGNGDFTISNHQGKKTVQNMKGIAEIYGSLTFFHFSPEEAMAQVFELIEMQFNMGQ